MLIPESLLRRLRAARRITVLTGAGVSAASGVPTFRGPDGLWRNFRVEELATAAAFRRDPALVWEWYAWRRRTIAGCEPNAAHHVIAEWSRRQAPGADAVEPWCTVVTQNVDDLHLRAGTEHLIRLHGSIWELQCWNACGQPTWRDERQAPPDAAALMPACPACGGVARPGVVWFGESLDPVNVDAALDACRCDLFLTVGTSAVVHPAAGLVDEAKRRGAFTVEINPDETVASAAVDLSLRGSAETLLPELSRLA